MRATNLLAPIVKKQAKDVTDLLVNSGYIKKSSAGVFSMLPLGFMVQQNIESIIRKRMNQIGGAEISLPTLAQASIWKQSGRIEGNNELFKLDSNKFVLSPTCEEEVTKLVSETIKSPRDLPLRLYQIGKKYRNELRPRGGLLRGKEFTMKDMYSFDKNQQNAHKTYAQVQQAYQALFKDIGVPIAVAEADSGAIGGSLSHEYHYLSDAGEDSLVHCEGCGYTANLEKARSYNSKGEDANTSGGIEIDVHYSAAKNGDLIAVYYPADRIVNPVLVGELIEDIDPDCRDPLSRYQHEADPMTRRLIRIIDPRVESLELPEPPVPVAKTLTTTIYEPIVEVVGGESCPSCDQAGLQLKRAIEVGHTFFLGSKYSKPFNCKVNVNDNGGGGSQELEMGCYGIGVSRMIAAIAEVTRDTDGLKWPTAVSPFDAVVVSLDEKTGLDLVEKLGSVGLSALWDDRSNQMGALLGASRAFGFPLTIIAGKRYHSEGILEVQQRHKAASKENSMFVSVNDLVDIQGLC